MPAPIGGLRLAGLVLALTLPLVGCGKDDAAASFDWRRGDARLATGEVAYAIGDVVHVGDVSIDVGHPVGTFVVAGDGVFVLAETETGRSDDTLLFASPDGDVVDTGVEVLDEVLRASPDGRHLVALDTASGERDAFGTPQAAVVAWDLATGEEVVRSTEPTGDPDEDDFADLYSELEIDGPVIDDDGFVIDAAGSWAFDFASGTARELDQLPGEAPAPDLPEGPWSLDREPVTPELYGWTDATNSTVLALLEADPAVLLTCAGATGECTAHPETAGQPVTLPAGSGTVGLDLTSVED